MTTGITTSSNMKNGSQSNAGKIFDLNLLIALSAQRKLDQTDFAILDAVVNGGCYTERLIADSSGIARSTVHRHIEKLRRVL